MKKITSVFLTLAMVLALCVPAFAAGGGTVTITTKSATKTQLTVAGTTSGVKAAVVVQLLSGEEILAMESLVVAGDSFSGVISGLSLTTGSSYTVRIADYDGGTWASDTVAVPADSTPTTPPSSGNTGGSSGSSSSGTTTTNPDGSTTTTITDKTTGAVTETTTSKPVTDAAGNTTQTTTETVTNKDGSTVETVTETVKAADGSTTETKTEVKTDADGVTTSTQTVKATDTTGTTAEKVTETNAAGETTTTVEATVSADAVAAAEDNAPITLPVSVVAPKTGDTGSTVVTVALPETVTAESTVKVEVPVANMTPGTVAVIVNEDGIKEVVDTTMGKNGVVIALEGNFTVKIVDNSKQFEDLDNAGKWITDAADYTSARGYFNGTGTGTTFSPEGEATRGAFVTVLHRMARKPDAEEDHAFGDVKEGVFYTDAVKWAAANDIVTGDGNYFGADDNITREQMAVMLYRYAEKLGLDVSARADMSEYTDADETSIWAKDAVSWARAHNLMTGGGDGRIAATAETNRAQVAAVIMRFCETVTK